MKTTLPSLTRGHLNFDGITELTEGGGGNFWTGLTGLGLTGGRGIFDRRDMKADEGGLFRPFTFHALSGGPVLLTALALQKHFTSINPW
jgi:hypothetical protein